MKKKPVPRLPKTKAESARDAAAAVQWLRDHSSTKVRDGMGRFGLPSDKALGVSVGVLQAYGRKLGRSQELAEALWDTDIYEARLLASVVGEPEKLTARSMDRWCADFDNWGVVDTVIFKLFDQSPHAWGRVVPWTKRKDEFQRRAGFVLIACLAAHNDAASPATLRSFLTLIEQGATDERNFVKKGVSWALRMMHHRVPELRAECVALARRLIASDSAAAKWVGRDALRQFRQ